MDGAAKAAVAGSGTVPGFVRVPVRVPVGLGLHEGMPALTLTHTVDLWVCSRLGMAHRHGKFCKLSLREQGGVRGGARWYRQGCGIVIMDGAPDIHT